MERTVVAKVYDPSTNEEYDSCWTWESGQNYARQNYKVIATEDDGYMTKAEAQSLYDYERTLAQDCWGLSDKETIEV